MAAQVVWLLALQPFTGGIWDAGISMRIGAELMLQEINAHSSLLDAYELRIIWQDAFCSAPLGTDLFMQNVFDRTYNVFAPGVNVSALDRDADGAITTADVAAFNEVWDHTQVSPDPVGLVGPACSVTAMNIVSTAYHARMPIISNTAQSPELSDRSRYPSFFRTTIPATHYATAYVALAGLLGQARAAVVVDVTSYAKVAESLAQDALDQGLTLVGADLTSEIPGFRGLLLNNELQSAARDVATELMVLKQRVVVLLLYASRARLLLCEAHKQGYARAVFMSFGWYAPGWWRVEDTDCTAAQLTSTVAGFMTVNMVLFRHDADVQLSCSQNMTVGQFEEAWYARQGADFGDLSFRPEGYAPYLEAATTADAVCMYALMLHEVLVVRNTPLASVAARTPATYSVIQEVLAATDFEGLQGRVRFPADSADPDGSMIIQQLQGGSMVDIATYTKPDFTFLGDHDLVFNPEETFSTAPAGTHTLTVVLTPYATCPEGEMLNMSLNTCTPCPANRVFVASLGLCVCAKGFATNTMDNSCRTCEAGRFTGQPGQLECEACPMGTFGSPTGSKTACERCEAGTFNNMTAQTDCASCDLVLRGSTTQVIAATDSSDCLCPEGAYKEGSECIECGKGTECREPGMSAPNQAPGFAITPWDAGNRLFSVYRCRNARECPGGEAGTCPENRVEIGCSHCETGTYPDDLGNCRRCTAAEGSISLLLAAVICLLLLLGITFHSRIDVTKLNLNSLAAGVCMGQVVVAAQMLTALNMLSVTWVEPIKSFIQVVSIISFRVELLNLSCLMHDGNVVGRFTFKLLMFPMGAATLTLIFAIQARVLRTPLKWDNVFNALGFVILILYMTLTLVSITPFQCLDSPNDTQSTASDPSVMCGSNRRFITLAILGFLGLAVYSLGFFSWILYVTVRYPTTVAAGGGHKLMSRYRFLFQRFEVRCYYYAPLYLMRSFFLALIPVAFANHAHRQILVFVAVMVLFLIVQSYLRPWRGWLPNLLDSIVSACLVLTLLGAALLLAPDDVSSAQVVQDMTIVFCVLLVALCGSIVGVFTVIVRRRIFPEKQFLAFLSHHKVACAAGARLLKMELELRVRGRIFLDSDDLDSLDNVLEYVRSCTQWLIVMLTSETLWRPWCVGEIVTACKNKVPTLCIQHDDYAEPLDSELTPKGLSCRWSATDISIVTLRGISYSSIVEAFKWIRGMSKLQIRRVGCLARECLAAHADILDEVVASLFGRSDSLRAKEMREMRVPSAESQAITPVIANNTDAEAVSTALVIATLIQTGTQRPARAVFHPSDLGEVSLEPHHFVLLLTPGVLTAHAWSETVIQARSRWQSSELCCFRVPDFQFPSKEQLEQTIYPQMSGILQVSVGKIRTVYREVTSILAFAFMPAEHITVIRAQADKLLVRMAAQRHSQGSAAAASSSELSSEGSDNQVEHADSDPKATELSLHSVQATELSLRMVCRDVDEAAPVITVD